MDAFLLGQGVWLTKLLSWYSLNEDMVRLR